MCLGGHDFRVPFVGIPLFTDDEASIGRLKEAKANISRKKEKKKRKFRFERSTNFSLLLSLSFISTEEKQGSLKPKLWHSTG